MIKVNYKVFFNDKNILKYITPAEKRVMSRQGSYVRSLMRSSMKSRTGKKSKYIASPPGTPPYNHVRGGFSIRSRIFFQFDTASRSVVIGVDDSRNKIGELHDKGGKRRIRAKIKGRIQTVTAKYPDRPFTIPALKKAQPKLTLFWEDQISPTPKPLSFSMISI